MVGPTRARSYPPGGRRWVQASGRERAKGIYRPDERRAPACAGWAPFVGFGAAVEPEPSPGSGARARRREVRRDLQLDRAARLADTEPVERPRRRAGDQAAVDAEQALWHRHAKVAWSVQSYPHRACVQRGSNATSSPLLRRTSHADPATAEPLTVPAKRTGTGWSGASVAGSTSAGTQPRGAGVAPGPQASRRTSRPWTRRSRRGPGATDRGGQGTWNAARRSGLIHARILRRRSGRQPRAGASLGRRRSSRQALTIRSISDSGSGSISSR
jgi:hypothetical protein